MLVVVLSIAAIAVIWVNVSEMEKQHEQEHRQLSASIAETSNQFMQAGQLTYFYKLLQLLTKISFVDYLAVHINGHKKLETQKSVRVNEQWIDQNKTGSDADWHARKIRQYYVNQPLYPAKGRDGVLTIVFSKKEYQKPIRIIQGAIGFIVLLLIVILVVMNKLRQTLGKLEYARKNKADTIYRITHDARQDLTVVQGKLTSVLRNRKKGTKHINVEKDLKTAHESTIALDRFLHNLNDQQRMEKGEVELLSARVDIIKIAHTVMSGFEENLALRKMRFERNLTSESLWVWADPQIAKRILMNLVHNAIKYSDNGEMIRLQAESDNRQVKIYISDQGHGIEKKYWKKIFQAYYQIDANSVGMGLGLANSRQLAKLMSGELGIVESVPGQGTTFYLALPASEGVKA